MKKLFQIISVTIVTVILTTTLVGCNPFDNGSTAYLTQKMDEIPIEFDGYEFSSKVTNVPSTHHFQGIVEFNGSPLEIQYKYKNEDGKSYDYFIKYKNKSWFIDDEFMRQRSKTYIKINNIWSDFKNGNTVNYPSEILGVYPFDGHLFIVTDGIVTRLQNINCNGSIPVTLYVFNLENEAIFYAGYYKKYTVEQPSLRIIKTGETYDEN